MHRNLQIIRALKTSKLYKVEATTIMLTTKCSAKCKHCPFSNPKLEHLFLDSEKVQNIVSQSVGKLTILSGGEPFEHAEISKILTGLSFQTNPFRIATGGFVDLTPWIEVLKVLSNSHGCLEGISMGTDVLSSRVDHSQWVPMWENNIRLFFQFKVPYSLTFTLDTDVDFFRFDLWKWSNFFQDTPKFIYLRYQQEALLNEWVKKIKGTFGNIPIIQDDLSYLS